MNKRAKRPAELWVRATLDFYSFRVYVFQEYNV